MSVNSFHFHRHTMVKIFTLIVMMFLLPSCDSEDNSPSGSTNVIVSADLPADIIQLIKQKRIIQAQLKYNNKNEVMDIIINGSAEKTIENYNFASLSLSVSISIDLSGELVLLAQADQTVTLQSGPENNIMINNYQYPDMDGDGVSNFLEIINNTDHTNSADFPPNIITSVNRYQSQSSVYTIKDIAISDSEYSPSSTNYNMDKSPQIVISAPNGVTQSEKQSAGEPLYRIAVSQ